MYCGKPEGEPDENYVAGTFNYITVLVEKLSRHQKLEGRNISMDRLYTSFLIANWLLQRKITMVGTLQANRVGIPPEIKKVDNREVLSSEVYWQEDGPTYLTSYVVKTSKGKKNVLMLSTVRPILGITKVDDKQKASYYQIVRLYKGWYRHYRSKNGVLHNKNKIQEVVTSCLCLFA